MVSRLKFHTENSFFSTYIKCNNINVRNWWIRSSLTCMQKMWVQLQNQKNQSNKSSFCIHKIRTTKEKVSYYTVIYDLLVKRTEIFFSRYLFQFSSVMYLVNCVLLSSIPRATLSLSSKSLRKSRHSYIHPHTYRVKRSNPSTYRYVVPM